MAAPTPIVQAIVAGARQRRIDPQAALAVAGQEGLSGGIGDQGHAFGPFQLNNAGGVLTGKFPGQTPQQIQAWAQSPAGIQYALDGIAKVASGLHGPQAVNAIVSGFERPANPGKEIAGALGAYGSPAPSAGAGATAPAGTSRPAGATAQGLPPIIASLLQNARATAGLAPSPIPLLMQQTPTQAAPTTAAAPRVAPANGAAGTLRLAGVPLGLDTRPGIQVDSAILPAVTQLAERFGVKVNSGYRTPQRNQQAGGAPGSDHLRGDAVDFTGTPQAMNALYKFARGRYPYVEPMAQTHGSHVHVSFRR